MNRFQAILKRTNDRLDLPRSIRSRILLEMAADLEDLFRHHLAEGLEEVEAARRAEEAVAISDDALARLVAVHRPALDRFTEHLAGHVAGGWQKLLFGALLAFAVLTAGHTALSSSDFLARSSVFVWPVLALGAAALGIVLVKLYGLVARPAADVRRRRLGLDIVLFLAAGSLAVGVEGLFVELFLVSRGFADGMTEAALGEWLIGVSSMMIVTLVTAICAALAWFALSRRIARIENREADDLLAAV